MNISRRYFVQQLALASAAATTGLRGLPAVASEQQDLPIAIFEKVFEALNYDELADAVAQIGADGVEATVRGNGHIKPEAAADEVPKMQAALQKRGKRIDWAKRLTTSANDRSGPRVSHPGWCGTCRSSCAASRSARSHLKMRRRAPSALTSKP